MKAVWVLLLAAVLISLAVLWLPDQQVDTPAAGGTAGNSAAPGSGAPAAPDSPTRSAPDGDGSARSHFFSAFGTIQAKLLEDDDLGAAISGLQRVLPTVTPAELLAIARKEQFSEQDAPLLHLLAEQFAETSDSSSVALLANAYYGATSEMEQSQLCLLVRDISHEEGLTALVELINAPRAQNSPPLDPLMRSAAFALASAPDPRWLGALLTTAARNPGDLQVSLLDGLAAVQSPQALPMIYAMIDTNSPLSGDPQFREIGVRLLGQIKSEESRDRLEQLRDAYDSDVATWAEEAAGNLKRIAPGLYSAIGQ